MQQVKEQGKNPPDQTSEEKIRSLPEKEFRIMIVKMTQNLENKMEAWLSRLEAWIKKMQEMFNKDLEELKNKQSTMNSAITVIKNTLEACNSRVTEAAEWIRNIFYFSILIF